MSDARVYVSSAHVFLSLFCNIQVSFMYFHALKTCGTFFSVLLRVLYDGLSFIYFTHLIGLLVTDLSKQRWQQLSIEFVLEVRISLVTVIFLPLPRILTLLVLNIRYRNAYHLLHVMCVLHEFRICGLYRRTQSKLEAEGLMNKDDQCI